MPTDTIYLRQFVYGFAIVSLFISYSFSMRVAVLIDQSFRSLTVALIVCIICVMCLNVGFDSLFFADCCVDDLRQTLP